MVASKKIQTIAELMNWPAIRVSLALKHGNVRAVNVYADLLDANDAAGAFKAEVREIPDWYYKTINDKPKNLSHAL